ncbi:DUF4159 domain-containing protein [Albirhodobacter sp. R86504]|uniref:DUF4159 domain-containing protein n=1 Tax=Albirhodobacter sp. R86504 TaxID=3093848 RepID=UPI003670DA3B
MIGFVSPWLLTGLIALPVLWLLLRAAPPAPLRHRFPAVVLLLGLEDRQKQAERTPWWVLLLRMLTLAAAIIGFAGPILNPVAVTNSDRPLLILSDASWALGGRVAQVEARIRTEIESAGASGRPVALAGLTREMPDQITFTTAEDALATLPDIAPQAWDPLPVNAANLPEGGFDTLWLSDGLERADRADLLAQLRARGQVRVVERGGLVALSPAKVVETALTIRAIAPRAGGEVEVAAIGLDPSGVERRLAQVTTPVNADAVFDLPPELRNRITRFEVSGQSHAGAVSLTDDGLKRRKVALVELGRAREGLELLSPLHYLRQALSPSVDLIEGDLADVLQASPDVIILADLADMPEADRLADWVAEGGLLLRFAGPRLAASDNVTDPLLPVTLRAGGRSVGGTMSWGAPRNLAPFNEDSPFSGLIVPDEVVVRSQVVSEPSPELADRVIASLEDGTPLVTRAQFDDGQVVLFHVTANAEWSSLPLSGLFVSMLERLAVSARAGEFGAQDVSGGPWEARKLLDARGQLRDAPETAGVEAADLAQALTAPQRNDTPAPGLYSANERQVALNVISQGRGLSPAVWPQDIVVEGGDEMQQMPLKGALISAALIGALLDIFASLFVAGRLWGPKRGSRRGQKGAALLSLLLAMSLLSVAPHPAQAETDPARAVRAAGGVVLAYVQTGDAAQDEVSRAGLDGLSQMLARRTTVEPDAPMAVDLETDDLALFTFLYWPITEDQPTPSAQAYLKINRYLRSGGMILFDTRDAGIAGFGTATPEGRRLQALAAPLDIPPLEPIPQDHVITRSFYLLQDFPGRHARTAVWVEAAVDAEEAANEGMPFRQLNDGVTPVVMGGNDWAAAWAVDARGAAMFPVGRGMGGERQREVAYRFGINLIMHVLTGNYKSDQVHVPALLERLGQ